MRTLTISLFALALAAPALAKEPAKPAPAPPAADVKKPEPAKPAGPRAHAEVKGADGKKLGDVTIEQLPHGVLITGELTGLSPGVHAFHVHEVGKCEPPFATAGGHFNPGGHKHGLKADAGAHAGDMPNLRVGQDGKVAFEVQNHSVSLKGGDPTNLADADGSALVIHATGDDYTSDPAGNAGGRIACGVITVDKP